MFFVIIIIKIFIGSSSTLLLSDHFWGANSDFCANFINHKSFCVIRENTPKRYGMGLSPPPPVRKKSEVL